MMMRKQLQSLASTASRGLSRRRHVHTSRPALQVYDSILETIGDTPVVRLNSIVPRDDITIYAKAEYFNPLSSVKDRLAIAVIEDAEASGALKPGQTVVEATSGNTGISLAMVCAAKGYPLVITMAESFSIERRKVMRALGAKVVLTPAAERGTGMVKKAQELEKKHGYFNPRQFENPANPAYHASTTGAEIVKDFAGKRLDYWVTGYGTGGTVTGAGRVIKAARSDTKIVLSEPSVAALIGSGEIQKDGETHPAWSPHPIQGWTPDFISPITQDGLNNSLVDEVVGVAPPDAIATSLRLAREEGIFTGVSGGATVATALDIAKDAEEGAVILAMLPDTAERYLSTPLFETIDADMNDAEKELSESTPGFQM